MEPDEILNQHKLKRTSCREGILQLIINANSALSEHEIKEKLQSNYDRTTFYRSFKTLEEHGIIHKIVVDNQIIKYAIDNSVTNKKEHAHFFCNKCERVVCMDSIEIPKIHLPEGFNISNTEFILKGECETCSKSKN